jgi:hypothetical protein
MEIKIVIDAPTGWKRRVLLYVVTPVALVAATALVARATIQNVDGSWVQSGQPVSASSLAGDITAINDNFTSLQAQVNALEAFRTQATADGGYSLGATYVGVTSTFNGAQVGGYTAAKQQCQTAYGASAHMCTTEEIGRSAQVGVALPTNLGWYSAAIRVGRDGNSAVVNDCFGWTSGLNTVLGAAATGPTLQPTLTTSSDSDPLLRLTAMQCGAVG